MHAVEDTFAPDVRSIWRQPEPRCCLLGLAAWRGFVAAAVLLVLQQPGLTTQGLLTCTFAALAGFGLAVILGSLQPHPRRKLAAVPPGATLLALGLTLLAREPEPTALAGALLGAGAGLLELPLGVAYAIAVAPKVRHKGAAMRTRCETAAILLPLVAAAYLPWPTSKSLWALAGLAAGIALVSWSFFLRPFLEQITEFVYALMYRFTAVGAVDSVPLRGPVIVIANHAAWLDPTWLAKVLPRTIHPMMTSDFYDLPILRGLMRHVIQAIRVQVTSMRREVPELKDAVRFLDRGRCLVIFPEGRLRRSDDRLLLRFGQGIWHILQQRPQTPVVACWIEGGWGSYFSFSKGPPTKNKPFDLRRPIGIAVQPAETLSPELLADMDATRRYLWQRCLDARGMLGLPAPGAGASDKAEMPDEPAPAAEAARALPEAQLPPGGATS